MVIWRRLFVCFGLFFALSTNLVAAKPPLAVAYNVQIARDSFGVPHIYGRTDADAAYGLAYALAEDDFANIEPLLAAARGQAGILLGRQGAVIDYGRQLFGIPAIVARDYARLPADVRAVLEGYAEGLNRYAQTHPDEVRAKKIFPVSGRDIAGGIALIAPQFYGLDRVLARLAAGRDPAGNKAPVGNDAPAGDNAPVGETRPEGDNDPAGDRGSNAFAVAPKKMSDGRTWLIANPHLPFSGAYALREAVIHSDEGLDMAGATLLGCPFLLLGHNRNLGWSITLNNPDLIDVYKLTLNANRDSYLYDGKWLPLEKQKVVLPVKTSLLTVNASRFVYRSVHGPVILNRQGAFAIRYAGMDSLRMVEQYYRLTKAQSWAQWQAAMDIGGIPSTNYVYADKTGRIAYVYNGLFPERKAGFDYAGVLAGDTSSNLTGAPVGFAKMPKVIDPASGFLFSANNTPFHATAPGDNLKPEDFSPLLGIEKRMTNRAWRAEELLSKPGMLTPDGLLAIKFDTAYSRNSYVGKWIGQLLAVDTRDRPDLAAAQALLKTWAWNSAGDNKANVLAELLIRTAKSANYDELALPDAKIVLDGTVTWMNKTWGRTDFPLDSMNQLRRGGLNLPMRGGGDTLRAAAVSFDAKTKQTSVVGGDSFVMIVNWDAAGQVVSQSVVPYGSSNRTGSPHYSDQMSLFANQRFKPVHFEWSKLLAEGSKPYRP